MEQRGRPTLEELVEGNRAWTRTSSRDGLEAPPRRQLSILTCMDARFTAQGILGLALGDAHVIRNAGGRVTDDVIRSLVLSAHVLGTRGCVVVHHTRCGLYATTNEAIHEQIREVSDLDASSIDFLPFADLPESVRADLARLRACELFPPDYEVLGFVYDVESGVITAVEEDDRASG